MPNPEIEALGKDSDDAQVNAAISSCVATEVNAGTPQDQAIAMCSQMVKSKMGK